VRLAEHLHDLRHGVLGERVRHHRSNQFSLHSAKPQLLRMAPQAMRAVEQSPHFID